MIKTPVGYAVAVVDDCNYERGTIGDEEVFTATQPGWTKGQFGATLHQTLREAKERCIIVNRDCCHHYSVVCVWREEL
ncbi:hypothetical protein LAC03_23720 [Levilactobacillus acidifarinae]|nr:hypothetical protein LAC03_23720 [Levilactobacillus acidifarinae]